MRLWLPSIFNKLIRLYETFSCSKWYDFMRLDRHKVHKGVKGLDCSRFSFVTVVSFVFEKGFPLITVEPFLSLIRWADVLKRACR
jgi:hypothetical protein